MADRAIIGALEFKIDPTVFYLVMVDERYTAPNDIKELGVQLDNNGIAAAFMLVESDVKIAAIQFDCAGTTKEEQGVFFDRIKSLKAK